MEVHDEPVPQDQYAEFVRRMPQVCVEVALQYDGAVLLARRTNEPVADRWFWPGSRLFKGEPLDDAARRVTAEELGVAAATVERLGVRSHVWAHSEESADVSRHTVNVIHLVTPDGRPSIELDDQHSDYRWVTEPDPDMHEHVHDYFESFDLPRSR